MSFPKTGVGQYLEAVGCINPRNDLPDDLEGAFIPMNLVPQKYGDAVQREIRQWGEIKRDLHISLKVMLHLQRLLLAFRMASPVLCKV
jgi:hypothetical protein